VLKILFLLVLLLLLRVIRLTTLPIRTAPQGGFSSYMEESVNEYNKTPLSIADQIERLKQRGLHFIDEQKASHYLTHISYYRLRAYTYPFQDNIDPNHSFVKKISFEEIIQLYVFDRRLRLVVKMKLCGDNIFAQTYIMLSSR
jgi:hypothetical protein